MKQGKGDRHEQHIREESSGRSRCLVVGGADCRSIHRSAMAHLPGRYPCQPAWVLSMWGPNFDWDFVQMVWFWAIAVLKFVVMADDLDRPLVDVLGEAVEEEVGRLDKTISNKRNDSEPSRTPSGV